MNETEILKNAYNQNHNNGSVCTIGTEFLNKKGIQFVDSRILNLLKRN